MGRQARRDAVPDATAGAQAARPGAPHAAWRPRPAGLLGQLAARLQAARGVPRAAQDDAGSTAFSTLSAPGRGRALRQAHRTLRLRLRGHPVLRQMMPHLWVLERAMARNGSLALQMLPIAVLQRCLQQLTLLQHDDETPEEAQDLRTLRLRLIETLAEREGGFDADADGPAEPGAEAALSRPAPVPGSCA